MSSAKKIAQNALRGETQNEDKALLVEAAASPFRFSLIRRRAGSLALSRDEAGCFLKRFCSRCDQGALEGFVRRRGESKRIARVEKKRPNGELPGNR